MRLRYSPRSIRQILSIAAYLAARNPSAAREYGRRIRDAIGILLDFPDAGHSGAQRGTKEFVVPGLPYVIVYRVVQRASEVRIAGIYHGAQLRPGQRRPRQGD